MFLWLQDYSRTEKTSNNNILNIAFLYNFQFSDRTNALILSMTILLWQLYRCQPQLPFTSQPSLKWVSSETRAGFKVENFMPKTALPSGLERKEKWWKGKLLWSFLFQEENQRRESPVAEKSNPEEKERNTAFPRLFSAGTGR